MELALLQVTFIFMKLCKWSMATGGQSRYWLFRINKKHYPVISFRKPHDFPFFGIWNRTQFGNEAFKWGGCFPIHHTETFDTIVSVSKLRYYCPKVSYRYRISIEILYLKSISIGIGIEISDIKVSVSVSVSPFNILGIKLCISTIFTP